MAFQAVPLAVGGLIVWRIYRRIRRNVGRQRLRPARSIISVTLFLIITGFLCYVSAHVPRLLIGLVAGLLGGATLGFVGLRLTRFETTAEGHFYTPNTTIGVALSLLIVGRLLYRYSVLSQAGTNPHHPQMYQSPLTFLIFGLIAGYSMVYYVGLFVHTRDRAPA